MSYPRDSDESNRSNGKVEVAKSVSFGPVETFVYEVAVDVHDERDDSESTFFEDDTFYAADVSEREVFAARREAQRLLSLQRELVAKSMGNVVSGSGDFNGPSLATAQHQRTINEINDSIEVALKTLEQYIVGSDENSSSSSTSFDSFPPPPVRDMIDSINTRRGVTRSTTSPFGAGMHTTTSGYPSASMPLRLVQRKPSFCKSNEAPPRLVERKLSFQSCSSASSSSSTCSGCASFSADGGGSSSTGYAMPTIANNNSSSGYAHSNTDNGLDRSSTHSSNSSSSDHTPRRPQRTPSGSVSPQSSFLLQPPQVGEQNQQQLSMSPMKIRAARAG